jgi:Mn-dependent DtxR family transcriptional regulator
MSIPEPPKSPLFTEKQGQYLTYIYFYTKINFRPPAQRDIEHYFQVSSASVHSMITTLKNKKLLSSKQGKPRSLKILICNKLLPDLK